MFVQGCLTLYLGLLWFCKITTRYKKVLVKFFPISIMQNEILLYLFYLCFFIGVFGGLDLFGKDVGVTWTKLASVALMGDRQIFLAENVSWAVGDEIVIGPSHYDAWETETFMITAVSRDGMTLTLNESLKYDHLGLYFFIMKSTHNFISNT